MWQVATVDASAWRVLFHVLAVEPGDQRWREHLHASRELEVMFSRCHPPTLWFGTNVGPWLLNESGVWRRQCRFPSGHWPSVCCWMSATRILRQTSEFHQVSHEHNSHYFPRDARCLWSFLLESESEALGARQRFRSNIFGAATASGTRVQDASKRSTFLNTFEPRRLAQNQRPEEIDRQRQERSP